MLAKAATVLDHATDGHFILGLGAGWHEGEHVRSASDAADARAVRPVRIGRARAPGALVAGRRDPPGVTQPDPFYPLAEATNEPPPLTPGGPPLGSAARSDGASRLSAAVAEGWVLPAVVALGSPTDLDYFSVKREPPAALGAIGRDPSAFDIVAQVPTGTTAEDRAWALGQARDAVRRGATTVILGMPPALGAAGVDAVAADIAIPLREAFG